MVTSLSHLEGGRGIEGEGDDPIDPETLQYLLYRLPSYGRRKCVGLRQRYGLRWWTYVELYERAIGVAAELRELGLKRGERVVVWGPNTPEWVGFLFGSVLRGVVVVPADEHSPVEFVERIAREVDAKLVVKDVAVGEEGLSPPWRPIESFTRTPRRGIEELAVTVRAEDPALIYFTSGTTSKPRGVVMTHGNLAAQFQRFRRWRCARPSRRDGSGSACRRRVAR